MKCFFRQHPKIRYHGTQPNAAVREALTRAHVFAYPSVWPETSCLCLIEAMSAGLVCVHSNLGALFETAAHWTQIYPFHEDPASTRPCSQTRCGGPCGNSPAAPRVSVCTSRSFTPTAGTTGTSGNVSGRVCFGRC
jgi:hypothetical protein